MKSLPLPSNQTYIYVREAGDGSSYEDARYMAIVQVFEHTANRLGIAFDSHRAFTAMKSGIDYDVIAALYNIPINLLDDYGTKLDDEHWCVYVLCQVVSHRNIVPIWEKGVNASSQDDITYLLRSAILPGLGQINKGYVGGGIVTMLSEFAFVGSALTFNWMSNIQLGVLDECMATNDVEGFVKAIDNYSLFRTASYVSWGAAGTLYLWNLIRAYTLTPRSEVGFSFVPSFMSAPNSVVPAFELTYRF